MKASVLLSVMLIAGISCVSEQTGIHTDGKTVRFCVSVDSGSATRASSAGSENALNRIQFVLFRDGILYSSASSDGISTYRVDIHAGSDRREDHEFRIIILGQLSLVICHVRICSVF